MPEGYARQPAGNLEADPDSPGIFRDSKLQAYIRANGQTWPVRYDTDNGTWRVYQPDNPTKYQYPVRLDAHGNWQVHGDTGIPGGTPPIPAETRQKAEALFRDGWTSKNIARRLDISQPAAWKIKRDANLPDIPSPPLQSIAFRTEVIARVNAGTPPEQIARDMHVQPETVEVIVEQYRRDGYVQLDTGGPLPVETRQKAEALSRDGWTTAAIARKLGISEFAVRTIKRDANLPDILSLPLQSIAFRTEVITRVNAGTPPEQIARDMHVQPETVELIVEQYRRDGQVKRDSGLPLPAETRQKAGALLRDGWTQTNVARRLGISQFAALRIRQRMNLPDIPSPPLRSPQIRKDVIARLQAGTPPAQIAQD
ncbi:hypothetical protein PQR32_42045, partial [Paraburkholderia dipogonis]